MKTEKVLIVVPAYNEATNLGYVIEEIREKFPEYDYLVINDGSTDGTEHICKTEHYNMLNLCINLGIGGGVQAGYQYAIENGYDYVVQQDGDGQHNPEYIQLGIDEMKKQGADIAIGSRFLEKKGFQSSSIRRVGIKWLSLLVAFASGAKHKIKDVTSGYRIVNRKYASFYAEDYPMDYPEPEAIVSAAISGAKIIEFPVIMRERRSGKSSISLSKSFYYIIKVSLAIFLRRLSSNKEALK